MHTHGIQIFHKAEFTPTACKADYLKILSHPRTPPQPDSLTNRDC